MARIPSSIAAAASMAAFVVGVALGTHAAGGSDSSCYLNAAKLIASGRVVLHQPLVRAAPWQNAAATFTPTGFTRSPTDPASIVPICSPGLPIVMAAFRVLRVSDFLVVPLLGALSVWLTFAIGRRIDRPLTGALAAALTVCSPTFLYQVVQPMSDVPAAAWWLLAIACTIEREDGGNRPRVAGVVASLALLTRPNLLPLAGVLAAYLFATRRGTDGIRCVARFAVGLVPGVLVLAILQRAMYGSPLATGYGSATSLLSSANVTTNLGRYLAWLLSVHTPFVLLSLASPAVVRRTRHAWLLLAIAATTLASYLPYIVFDAWWYTRFLLPAIPLLVVLSVCVLMSILDRLGSSLRPRVGALIAVASVVVVMAVWLAIARERHAFELSELEQHYYRAGVAIAEHVPDPSAILTVKDSGAVLYHTGRPTISWDTLGPSDLDHALTFARERGYPPYVLLEIDEEPVFRERFGRASALGRLDWPPRVQVGRSIRIYDPLDREKYLEDGQLRTRFVPDAPLPARNWRSWLSRR